MSRVSVLDVAGVMVEEGIGSGVDREFWLEGLLAACPPALPLFATLTVPFTTLRAD
jgi:hypothetical protein